MYTHLQDFASKKGQWKDIYQLCLCSYLIHFSIFFNKHSSSYLIMCAHNLNYELIKCCLQILHVSCTSNIQTWLSLLSKITIYLNILYGKEIEGIFKSIFKTTKKCVKLSCTINTINGSFRSWLHIDTPLNQYCVVLKSIWHYLRSTYLCCNITCTIELSKYVLKKKKRKE